MIPFALGLILKVTAVAAAALIGAWMARRNRAAVRHAVLAAGFGVMALIPFTSLVAPPVRIEMPVADHTRTEPVPGASLESDVDEAPQADVRVFPFAEALFAIWAAGSALSFVPMLVGLWRIHRLRREATRWARFDGGAVEVVLHESIAGPMTCGVLRPAILMPADAGCWAEEDLDRAMVHEREHVRRRDWAVLCFARAVAAVYWFHPLVRLALRRLALEAERACDDAVLRLSEPTAYADQLVGLARRLAAARKTPALAMASRTDLAARVRALLDSRQRRGRAGAATVALACAGAVALVMAVSPLTIAQTPVRKFDAVSVKLVDANMQDFHSHENGDPGRLRIVSTMHRLVLRAWGITDNQLSGEPEWFRSHLYSIEAVTSAPASREQMMLMLRDVLAERFQLKVRQAEKDLPVYSLEVAPGGPKFQELRSGDDARDPADTPGVFAKSFNSLKDLMNALNGVNGGRLGLDRPVLDHTRLTGTYNIQLSTEIETQADGQTRVLPNLMHDIQSQLGLRLVSTHAALPCLVVVSAAEPSAN
jgi:uncharacterized protein (TIGR03435 family)